MVELTVFDDHASVKEKISFDEEIFGTKVKTRLLREVVIAYEAAQRLGIASAKTRGERAGSGKKPWKQKGTGRARVGSIRSPLWRGGGVIFGPKPRDFTKKVNKKARREALRCALLSKFRDGEVFVLDGLKLDAPKTKIVADLVNAIEIPRNCLLVTKNLDENMYKSGRNVEKFDVMPLGDLNAYDILRSKSILFLRDALDELKERVKK